MTSKGWPLEGVGHNEIVEVGCIFLPDFVFGVNEALFEDIAVVIVIGALGSSCGCTHDLKEEGNNCFAIASKEERSSLTANKIEGWMDRHLCEVLHAVRVLRWKRG